MTVPSFPKTFNLATYFLESNLDAGRSGKTAVLSEARTLTYAEVDREARQVAQVLRGLGVDAEDRVLVCLPDRAEFVTAWFAVLKLGAVVAMVNPLVPAEDIAYYLDYTRARAIVTSAEVAAKARVELEQARHLRVALIVGDPPEGKKNRAWLDHVPQADPDLATEPTDRDDPAIWLFTSGSTGRPKAAVHFHHDFAWNTELYAKKVVGYREDDVTLSVPKLFFGYATGTNLMFPFAVGATTALFEERATASSVYQQIERWKPTILTSVPTMINAMLAQEGGDRFDLRSLRLTLSAGEALPEELYRRWKERTGIEILDGIGSAELFHIYISNRPGDVRPGSLGKLVPGYEARVVRDDGQEAAPGEIGTLWVKGDSAAVFYWRDHEKSKQVLRGDWVVSGDLFERDAEGYFKYSGRADDLLKVGGVFVAPVEIEACLLTHPCVREVCVLGYEEEGLVKPLALVVPNDGVTGSDALSSELKDHVKKNLAPYKYPRRVVFRTETLPKNDRGKTDRKALKDALARGELG